MAVPKLACFESGLSDRGMINVGIENNNNVTAINDCCIWPSIYIYIYIPVANGINIF
jgi:hypothetical protein